MVIRKIDPLSVGKIAGLLYAVIGLLIGALVSVIAMAGARLGGEAGDSVPLVGMLFGAGAIIFLPICYGIVGFIGSVVAAAIYNIAAGVVGGIRIDVDQG